MSYEQHMKHYRNHRKDRHCQQCSGYFGDGKCEEVPPTLEELREIEKQSFAKLLEAAKSYSFPVHIFMTGRHWRITDKPNLFSLQVNSYEELLEFGKNYVG